MQTLVHPSLHVMQSQTEISLACRTGACSGSWLLRSCPQKLSTGHQHRHLANVAGQAEVHLRQRAWGQWMAGPGGKILVDKRESSFLQDRGVDEGGVLRGIWVSKQWHSPPAVLISHLQFGSPKMEICRGVCICICLFLSTCENQLFRCYQATATELSRSVAAATSSRAGPPGCLSEE